MIIRIILFAGLCYVALLLSFITKEIQFSEDSGIKTLMVKQYQNGEFKSTLVLDAPEWVRNIWHQGLYPFREPFVYDLPSGKTTVFPPLFQIITTPLYQMFGFRGLYIIPALSAFLLWVLFARICSILNINERIIQLALIAIIFSSSLTVYSAIFWEHTLASLLCLSGLYYLIQTSISDKNPSKLKSFLFGIIAALALWLRPEALIILIALLGWSVYYILNTKLKSIRFFVLGILISVVGLFLFNYFIFENPLGLRSKQIVDRFDVIQRLKDGGYIFIVLCLKTILFDPICLLVLFCTFISSKSLFIEFKIQKTISVTYLIILSVSLFYITSPWILPNTGGNNWGIRYALICTPYIYVLAAILSDRILTENKKVRTITIIALLLITIGITKNSIGGSKMLFRNYRGAKSQVLDYLTNENIPVLLITKSYHAGEFESLMPKSAFILTDSVESLQLFLASPESKDINFVLLYDKGDAYSELKLKENNLNDFTLQKRFDNFLIYKPIQNRQNDPSKID